MAGRGVKWLPRGLTLAGDAASSPAAGIRDRLNGEVGVGRTNTALGCKILVKFLPIKVGQKT